MDWLAIRTEHRSPNQFQQDVNKFRGTAQIIDLQIKTVPHGEVVQELSQLNQPTLMIGGGDLEKLVPQENSESVIFTDGTRSLQNQ